MNVKEFYENNHGSYTTALNMMMNDDFIKRMLSKFISSNRSLEMIECYKNKDYKGVFEAGHSLKGVAGNLALTSLYDLVVPIVEKTRNYSNMTSINLDDEIASYQKEYEQIIAAIKELID